MTTTDTTTDEPQAVAGKRPRATHAEIDRLETELRECREQGDLALEAALADAEQARADLTRLRRTVARMTIACGVELDDLVAAAAAEVG